MIARRLGPERQCSGFHERAVQGGCRAFRVDFVGIAQQLIALGADRLSEEELLAGIEGLVPPEKNDDY